jgi:hypothetical protein
MILIGKLSWDNSKMYNQQKQSKIFKLNNKKNKKNKKNTKIQCRWIELKVIPC